MPDMIVVVDLLVFTPSERGSFLDWISFRKWPFSFHNDTTSDTVDDENLEADGVEYQNPIQIHKVSKTYPSSNYWIWIIFISKSRSNFISKKNNIYYK